MAARNDLDADRRLRCAIYLRISHDPFGTSTAPERQLEDCRRFAELRGWDVVEIFEDRDTSAFREGVVRPRYEEMLSRVDEFDVVLVWRLDRLVRRIVEFNRFWSAAEAAKVVLASATQPIDTSDALGLAFVYVIVGFAQAEAEAQSTRIKSLQNELARNGKSRKAGHRPFGLTKDWSATVPDEADIVAEVADRMLAGEAVAPLVRELNERGIKPVASERWTRRSLVRMMSSARIFGWREHLGELTAAGDWPALIDEATGRALRDLINARSTESDGRRKHVLSGILRCSRCNTGLKATTGSKRERRYICPPPADGGCSGISIDAEKAERDVEKMIRARLATPELARALKARKERKSTSTEAQILAELEDLDRQTKENAVLRRTGELPRKAWAEAERDIERQTDILNARLVEMRKGDPLEPLGDNPVDAYGSLPVARQRAVIKFLVQKIVVHRKGDDYYLRHLRVALAEEADEMQARADELRDEADCTDDREKARRLRAEARDQARFASRRRMQARDGTGGGRWRPERLEPVWRD